MFIFLNVYQMSITSKQNDIQFNRAPQVLFYGDSHIGRLCEWRESIARGAVECIKYDLCLKVLSKSLFVYSGGSCWDNIHTRVQGFEVPWHQLQGDTWSAALDDGLIPEIIYWSCGANDLDRYNDLYFDGLRHSKWWHLLLCTDASPSKFYRKKHCLWTDDVHVEPMSVTAFDHYLFIDTCHKEIKKGIDQVVTTVNRSFSGCVNYMAEIPIRKNWFPAICNLAGGINAYCRKVHEIRICKLNRYLAPNMICKDQVHLNHDGYLCFMDHALCPMLDYYYKCIRVPRHLRPIPQITFTRSARKRRNKKARMQSSNPLN